MCGRVNAAWHDVTSCSDRWCAKEKEKSAESCPASLHAEHLDADMDAKHESLMSSDCRRKEQLWTYM